MTLYIRLLFVPNLINSVHTPHRLWSPGHELLCVGPLARIIPGGNLYVPFLNIIQIKINSPQWIKRRRQKLFPCKSAIMLPQHMFTWLEPAASTQPTRMVCWCISVWVWNYDSISNRWLVISVIEEAGSFNASGKLYLFWSYIIDTFVFCCWKRDCKRLLCWYMVAHCMNYRYYMTPSLLLDTWP